MFSTDKRGVYDLSVERRKKFMTYAGSHLEILDRFGSQFLWIKDLFDIKLFTSLCLICSPFTLLENCHGLRRGLV